MRYLLPIYPLLAMMAAWFLWWLVEKARSWKLEARSWKLETGNLESDEPQQARKLETLAHRQLPASSFLYAAYALLVGVTVLTMLWGWGFLAIYRRPLSRITASQLDLRQRPGGQRHRQRALG